MSMCNCNQGRLPCTCKPIEGATVMSEVKRFDIEGHDWEIVVSKNGDWVTSECFDRLTAERDALQERLNAADQEGDDLSFQLNDREGSRRDWFEEAQRLEKEVEALRKALKFYADREHYHFESGNWDTVSGEPLNILWCGDEPDFIEDGTVARNALSASAEPRVRCHGCGEEGVRPDHFDDGGKCIELQVPNAPVELKTLGGEFMQVVEDNFHELVLKSAAPVELDKQCTDGGMCGDSSHKCTGCAPVERDERAEFNAWLNEVTHEEYTDNGVFKVQRHQELSVSDKQIAWDTWQARAALDKPTEGLGHE